MLFFSKKVLAETLPWHACVKEHYVLFISYFLIFCIFTCVHSDQIMPLQFWISAVMLVAMVETTMLYFHFIDWNEVRHAHVLASLLCLRGMRLLSNPAFLFSATNLLRPQFISYT